MSNKVRKILLYKFAPQIKPPYDVFNMGKWLVDEEASNPQARPFDAFTLGRTGDLGDRLSANKELADRLHRLLLTLDAAYGWFLFRRK